MQTLPSAHYFHPLGFIRSEEDTLSRALGSDLRDAAAKGHVTYRQNGNTLICVRPLTWDSQHFGCPMYRYEYAGLINVSSPRKPKINLTHAFTESYITLKTQHPLFYAFIEADSRDIDLIQAIGPTQARLVETRLTYAYHQPREFKLVSDKITRMATNDDCTHVAQVAASARNPVDRVHADPFFSLAVADEYLATYAANSVLGFADMVLVPADSQRPVDAFMALKSHVAPPGTSLKSWGQITLAAVAPTRRGWHRHLMIAATHWFGAHDADMVVMTTQASNGAVIANCEKLGYRLARVSHLFAFSAGELSATLLKK